MNTPHDGECDVALGRTMTFDPACDYPEDFHQENGEYLHRCRECGVDFVGHKHRPNLCRKCKAIAKAKWDALTDDERHAELAKTEIALETRRKSFT